MKEETKRAILDLVYPIGIVIGWHDDSGPLNPEKAFGGEWKYVGEMEDESDGYWRYCFYKRVG